MGQNHKRLAGDNVTVTEFPAWAYAASLAGQMAGSKFGQDTATKALHGELVTDSTWGDLYDAATDLVKARATFGRKENGAYRTVRCLTTWQDDETFWKIEPTVIDSMSWSLRDLNRYLDDESTSAPQAPNNAKIVAALAGARMQKQSELNNTPVLGFLVHGATQIGNSWVIDQDATFTGSTLFGTVNTNAVEFSDSTA